MKRTGGCARSKMETVEGSLRRWRRAITGRGGGARGTDNAKRKRGERREKERKPRCARVVCAFVIFAVSYQHMHSPIAGVARMYTGR